MLDLSLEHLSLAEEAVHVPWPHPSPTRLHEEEKACELLKPYTLPPEKHVLVSQFDPRTRAEFETHIVSARRFSVC